MLVHRLRRWLNIATTLGERHLFTGPLLQRQTRVYAVTAVCLCSMQYAVCQYLMAEENHAAQRQTAVTAYL